MKLLAIILTLFTSVHASAWTEVARTSTIEIHKKQYKSTDLFVLRGRTAIKTSQEKTLSVIMDTLRHKYWIPGLIKSEVVKHISKDEKVVKQSFALPWPCDDRWMTYTVKVNRGKNTITVDMSSSSVKASGNGVRAELMKGSYVLTTKRNYTHVELKILIDPKGSIPTFMLPEFQREWMIFLLTNIKKMV